VFLVCCTVLMHAPVRTRSFPGGLPAVCFGTWLELLVVLCCGLYSCFFCVLCFVILATCGYSPWSCRCNSSSALNFGLAPSGGIHMQFVKGKPPETQNATCPGARAKRREVALGRPGFEPGSLGAWLSSRPFIQQEMSHSQSNASIFSTIDQNQSKQNVNATYQSAD
jgi:hypothetical protein